MPTFVFTELVNDPPARVDSACLGVDGQVASRFGDNDVGKAVKMGTANNFVLCDAGDEIEGFVSSISAEGTYNGGFSFGGVQRDRRILAEIGANQGATPAAVGDYVVADDQIALGTAGLAQVKTGTAFSQLNEAPYTVTQESPRRFKWRIIRIVSNGPGGAGTAGSVVLLNRE